MNKYIEMFAKYSALRAHDCSIFSKDEENFVLTNLKTTFKAYISDGDDSDSFGGISSVLVIDEARIKKTKDKIILTLYNLLQELEKTTEKIKLINIISTLITSIDKEKEDLTKEKQINDFSYDTPINFSFGSFNPSINPIIQRKYEFNRLFALKQLVNPEHLPTKKPEINITEFKELSTTELVSLFKAENFYKLSKDQVNALFQAVANDYLIKNGVEPCAVELTNLTLTNSMVCYGEYNPNTGVISLNKNLLDKFDYAKALNDQYFPYQMLTTIIHEASHRIQFANIDKDDSSAKHYLISNALKKPQSFKDFSEYLSSADELDARNSALSYLRENIDLIDDNEALAQFYNLKKKEEFA